MSLESYRCVTCAQCYVFQPEDMEIKAKQRKGRKGIEEEKNEMTRTEAETKDSGKTSQIERGRMGHCFQCNSHLIIVLCVCHNNHNQTSILQSRFDVDHLKH